MRRSLFCLFLLSLTVAAPADEPQPKVGERLPRRGDEIVVCGQLYHTTTKVILWTDPGGFDAYRVEPRFGPSITSRRPRNGRKATCGLLITTVATAAFPKPSASAGGGATTCPN